MTSETLNGLARAQKNFRFWQTVAGAVTGVSTIATVSSLDKALDGWPLAKECLPIAVTATGLGLAFMGLHWLIFNDTRQDILAEHQKAPPVEAAPSF